LPLASYIRTDDQLTAPDVVFVHTLPLDCAKVLEIAGFVATAQSSTGILTRERFRVEGPSGGPCRFAAYTTWEGASAVPPEITGPLGIFDRVYVPSLHNYDRLRATVARRILPHAYDCIDPNVTVPPPDDRYRFYYIGAWTSRKNPVGIIRAYAYAFRPGDKVELLLRCAGNSELEFVVNAHSTGIQMAELAPIRFSGKTASDGELAELHRYCDCFVTATRGEAWNLPAFDAMVAGRHIIAPAEMGHADFLEDTSAAFYTGYETPAEVDVRIAERRPDQPGGVINIEFVGAQGLTGRSTWLEPDLLQLAQLMRQAYDERKRDLAVQYSVPDRYSYAAVGDRLRKDLEDL
jgi:glycosyltransferase involved in cell wall biosynthesis